MLKWADSFIDNIWSLSLSLSSLSLSLSLSPRTCMSTCRAHVAITFFSRPGLLLLSTLGPSSLYAFPFLPWQHLCWLLLVLDLISVVVCDRATTSVDPFPFRLMPFYGSPSIRHFRHSFWNYKKQLACIYAIYICKHVVLLAQWTRLHSPLQPLSLDLLEGG